jgi:hypothetical protein
METKLKKTNNKYCSQIKIGLKHPAYVTFRLTPTDGIHFREPYRRLHSLSILPARFASLLLQRTQQKSISWPTTKGCVLPCRALQRGSTVVRRRFASRPGELHFACSLASDSFCISCLHVRLEKMPPATVPSRHPFWVCLAGCLPRWSQS